MRFALIDNKLTEAASGLKGFCPGCSQPVTAKCGTQRIHHWAHRNNKMCDNWWEPETVWHRSWKNNFPEEWHEVFLLDDQTGEKHVADVRTIGGLVIEFQHSHIDPKERTSRESFYQDMVWVVDGTRLKADYQRFLKGKKNYSFSMKRKGFFRIDHRINCFPLGWTESSVPVIFDFQGNETITDVEDVRNDLYCLFPKRLGLDAVFAVIPRKIFVDASINNQWSQWIRNCLEAISLGKLEPQQHSAVQQVKRRIIRREPLYFLERGRWKKRWRL